MKHGFSFLCVAVCGLFAFRGAVRGASCVALIAGEGQRAPAAAVFARLEAALSTNSAFALVEREQVRRVLDEQHLGAANLSSVAAVLKLGELLPADLFVFVEKLPESTNAAWRVSCVEARTGVALGGWVASEASLATNHSSIAAAITAAAAKAAVPPADRRFVGMLGFRSEEFNRGLDGLAGALEMLLATDLADTPAVVLLDREHLDHLTTERELTQFDQELKLSAQLIEGSVRRIGPGVELKLFIRPLAGTNGTRLTRELPGADVSAARGAARELALEHFHLAAPAQPPGDPSEEAALFESRARVLLAHGEVEAGLSAAEAAVALAPTLERDLLAANAWNAEKNASVGERWPGAGTLMPRPGPGRLAVGSKERTFFAALRELEHHRLAMEEHAACWQWDKSTRVTLPAVSGGWGPEYRISPAPDETEAIRLRAECQRAALANYRFQLDYYTACWKERPSLNPGEDARTLLLDRLWHSLSSLKYWTDDPREWAALLNDSVNRIENLPKPLGVWQRENVGFYWMDLANCTDSSRYAEPGQRRVVVECLDELAGRGNPSLRVAAFGAKLHLTADYLRTAKPGDVRPVLDAVINDMLTAPASVRTGSDHPFPHSVVIQAFTALREPKEKGGYIGKILGPLVEARDLPRLMVWADLVTTHWTHVDNSVRREWLGRIAALMREHPEMTNRPAGATGFRRNVEQELASLEGREFTEPLPAAWQSFEVRKLDFHAPAGNELVAMRRHGSNWFFVWSRREDTKSLILSASMSPLEGGGQRFLGKTPVGRVVPDLYPGRVEPLPCAATDGEAVYVGTDQGGLVIFRGGRGGVLTEADGLPENNIRSVAVLGGKVYLGMNGLVELDPATGKLRVLASSRSPEQRSGLDGGRPYEIVDLVADPRRDTLWISTGYQLFARVTGPSAVWRFHVATERFERLTNAIPSAVAWRGGRLVGLKRTGLFEFNPDSLESEAIVFARPYSPRRGETAPVARFGVAPVTLWPAAWLDDSLFVIGAQPGLLRRGDSEPALFTQTDDGQKIRDVRFIETVGDEIVAGTRAGELWKIRRKP